MAPQATPSAQYCTPPHRAERARMESRDQGFTGGSRMHSCQRQGGWFASPATANARTNQAEITQAFIKCSRVSNFEQTRAC